MSFLSALIRNGDDFARHFGSHADDMAAFMRAGRNADDIAEALSRQGSKSLDDILADMPADLQSKARAYFRPLQENIETITRMEDAIRAGNNIDLDALGQQLGKSPDELAQMLGKTTDELTNMLRGFQDEIAETAAKAGTRNAAGDRFRQASGQGDDVLDATLRETGEAAARPRSMFSRLIPGRKTIVRTAATVVVIGGAGITLKFMGVGGSDLDIPEGEQPPTQAELEAEVRANFNAAKEAVPGIVSWINQNREEINAAIFSLTTRPDGTPATDEWKRSMLISEDIPADAELTSAAFLHAYDSVIAVANLEPVQSNQAVFEALQSVDGVLEGYSAIYEILGDDAQVAADPIQAMKDLSALNLRRVVSELDRAQVFGDLPDFDLATDPYNLTSPEFLSAYSTALVRIEEQVGPIIAGVLQNEATPENVKTALAQAQSGGMGAQIEVLLQTNVLTETEAQKVGAAYALLIARQNLDPSQAAALAPVTQAAIETVTRTPPGSEPRMSMEEVLRIFTPDIRHATMIVEEAFDNRGEYDPDEQDWHPDQFLDHRTRHEVHDIVMDSFKLFGDDFHGENISRVVVQTDPSTGEEKYFAFNDDGYIFEVEISGGGVVKDHAYATDPDFPVTARLEEGATATIVGQHVGRIDQGIHVRDEDGQINTVHVAAAAFMGWVSGSLEKEQSDRNVRIDGFFQSIGDETLEQELRLALADRNLTLEQFRTTDLFRRVKDAKGDDGATEQFVTQLFSLDLNRFTQGADTLGLSESAGEASAVYNLLRNLAGTDVNTAHQNLRDQTPFARDNILSRNGYEIMKQMRHGEHVALAVLEDSRQDEFGARQRAALHKEFANAEGVVPQTVSREQVHAFVRKQFDLRAITTLGDLRLEQSYLDSMSEEDQEKFREMLGQDLTDEMVAAMSVEAQNALIRDNANVLDRVSMAMAEGRFNPDDRDVRLVFKAFERPELDNQTIRDLIDSQRAAGRIPTAEYALNYFTKPQLESITGLSDFNDPTVYTLQQQKDILDELFRNPTPALLANPDYERLTMNFYEPFLANYTWFRNGEVDDDTMNTWNGRYGEPGQDQLMHMFMQYNMMNLEQHFPDGAHRVFYQGGLNSVDFTLTYDEVRARLAEMDAANGTNHVASLDHGIEALNRPSMYMYLMDMRLGHYRDLRNNHYIPGLKDRQITAEFNRALTDEEPTVEEPRNDPPIRDPPIATIPDGAEPLDETVISNPGVLPSAVMTITRQRPGVVTGTDLILTGESTDITVRPYDGTRPLSTVIPQEILDDPDAMRDIKRAATRLKGVDHPDLADDVRARWRADIDSIKERYGLTDAQVKQYGDAIKAHQQAETRARAEAEARAKAEAEGRATDVDETRMTPTDGDGSRIQGTGEGSIRADADDIIPTERALVPYEGHPLVTTDPEGRALMPFEGNERALAIYEPGAELAPDRMSIPWGRTVSGGAAALSLGLAFTDTDEGHKVGSRLAVGGLDAALAVDDIFYNSRHFGGNARFLGMQGGKVLASGGVAIVATTSVEVGIALANKDGQAAGAATTVGAFALGGMAAGAGVGSVVPGVGTVAVGAVGTVVGTIAGIGVVAYTSVEDPLGRFYNDIVYNGSWFNDGMIKETEDLLEKVDGYKTRLEAGNLSQAELAEYQQTLEELEDHLMDLRKAEVTLASLAIPSFTAVDADGDGNITEAEMNADDSADHKNIQFWVANRRLQTQLETARADLNTAYDQERVGGLTALLAGTSSADDVEQRLRGEFSHVANGITEESQINWNLYFWGNTKSHWEDRLKEAREQITFDSDNGEVLAIGHLTHTELEEAQREVHNVREEIEHRIQNLLYNASQGALTTDEYRELKELRDMLVDCDELETALWAENGPLGDRAFQEQEVTQMDRARQALDASRLANGQVNRDALEAYLNRAENIDIVRGRDQYNWLWLTTAGVDKLTRRVNEYDLTEGQLDGLSEEGLREKYEDLQEVGEDLENRIYNLMIDAAEGNLSRDEAEELDKALEAHKQYETAKAEYEAQFRENAGDITGQNVMAPGAQRNLVPGATR